MEEITISVKDRQGQIHQLHVPLDIHLNIMEVCKAAELPVLGTCGGMALCSTCHIYIHSSHILSEMNAEEEEMLDQAFQVRNNSRLGCQITLQEEHHQLSIELAPE